MTKTLKPWTLTLVLGLLLTTVSARAQAPATLSLLGQVESVDASARTLKLKTEDGSVLSIVLAEKGTVMKVAPGETSLQNAAPIGFDGIAAGDRVLVRGGVKNEGAIEGALRIVVMARSDLQARNENEQRAWRERGIAGTLVSADAQKGEFTLSVPNRAAPPAAGAAATPTTLVVDAKKATLHRYADTSVKFDDAKTASVADMAPADQVRVLGQRSADGATMTAERVVFGSFKTMALAIEKLDPSTGQINVKDLESNRKFTITLVPGASIRRIPAEMAAMLGGSGRAGGGMGQGGPGAARPEGARGQAPGGGGMGMGGGRPMGGGMGGGPRGGRGMEDIVERMPTITLADLKKDDWIGAVVGKADASGKAVAFTLLAGIDAFASRANRSGGVDVGMPAGLLDGGFGVP